MSKAAEITKAIIPTIRARLKKIDSVVHRGLREQGKGAFYTRHAK